MKKFRITYLAVLILLASACATQQGQQQRSAIDQAKLTYADASLAYETAMLSLQDARRAHLVTDAQWSRVDQAQANVRTYAPLVRTALDLWEQSGSKPDSYAAALSKLLAAFAEVQAVKGEVKP